VRRGTGIDPANERSRRVFTGHWFEGRLAVERQGSLARRGITPGAEDGEALMGFVQIIDFTTNRYDDVRKVMEDWTAATEGTRTTSRWMVGKDRDRALHYVQVVEFPSYGEAMRNNDLPQTKEFSQKIADLCEDVYFYNIDDVETFQP
jgi:hypothetical protein